MSTERDEATLLRSLQLRIEAIERAAQLRTSTVPGADGEDVDLGDAVAEGVTAGEELPALQAELDGVAVELDAMAPWAEALGAELDATGDYLAQVRTELEAKLSTAATDLAAAAERITAAEEMVSALDGMVAMAIAENLDEYTVTSSATAPPGPDAVWSPDTPDWETGQYVWRRTKSTHVDGSVGYSSPAVITGVDGAPGADAVLLRVSSSKGTAFKNSAISTVLTATVFRGALQIVNLAGLWEAFGSGAYLEWRWRRIDEEQFGVISSADPRLSQGGFALTISPADVDEKTDFQCILHD